MRYITLGQDDKELSEIVLGMMRIEDKSVKEVEELVENSTFCWNQCLRLG